jgi:hypothetical protein
MPALALRPSAGCTRAARRSRTGLDSSLEVGWEFRRWKDGRVLSAENLMGVCDRLYGEKTYTVHRADLLDALKSAVPAGAVQLGRRCTAVDLNKQAATPRFAEGSIVEAVLADCLAADRTSGQVTANSATRPSV